MNIDLTHGQKDQVSSNQYHLNLHSPLTLLATWHYGYPHSSQLYDRLDIYYCLTNLEIIDRLRDQRGESAVTTINTLCVFHSSHVMSVLN